jgi:hypothetical protein
MEGDRSPVVKEVRVLNTREVPWPEETSTHSSPKDTSDGMSDDGTDMKEGGAKLWTCLSPPIAMYLGLRPLWLVAFGSWSRWAISPKVP